MAQASRHPGLDRLPPTIPIFPLAGALLLPRGLLPLNIFEPRYLAMVEDALAAHRIIGMIQPMAEEVPDGPPPRIYGTGCAGRITAFEETEDGRYLITLTGINRFRAGAEQPPARGYRRVAADWSPFSGDAADAACTLDRPKLLAVLNLYFKQQGIAVNWKAIESTPDDRLVVSLCMICPFAASEKQALLEAPTLADRAQLMTSLIEMAVMAQPGGEPRRH